MYKTIGNKIKKLKSTNSTNSYLKNLNLTNQASDGFLIYTNEQIAGRGQRGNVWESENEKNLLLSFIIYPQNLSADKQFILSKIASLAVADLLSQHTNNVKIKWPNDIYIDNKKIAGILIENTLKGSNISSSVIGIGININQKQFSTKIPNPTSLNIITEKHYDIDKILNSLIEKLNFWYNMFSTNEIKTIDSSYTDNLFRYNEYHNYIIDDNKIKAKITGIDKNGKLIILTNENLIKTFAFKEIIFCI